MLQHIQYSFRISHKECLVSLNTQASKLSRSPEQDSLSGGMPSCFLLCAVQETTSQCGIKITLLWWSVPTTLAFTPQTVPGGKSATALFWGILPQKQWCEQLASGLQGVWPLLLANLWSWSWTTSCDPDSVLITTTLQK